MADLTPIIAALLGGGYQGYRDQEKANIVNAKNKSALAEKGFAEGGDVDQGYYNPESPSYKRAEQYAKFHAASSAKASPTVNPLTFGQVFAARGEALPEYLKPFENSAFDHRYAGILGKKAEEAPLEMINDPKAFAQSHPNAMVKAPFAGAVKPSSPKPGDTPMTPEQQAAYETMMGLPKGAASNLTRQNFASGVSNVSGQRAAGERQGKAIAATGERQDKALKQGEEHFEKAQTLQKNKAVMDDATRLEQQIAKLGRVGNYIDTAEKMNMSYPDYLELVARSKVGNVAGYLGSDIGKLDPTQEERLGKYREIGGGFVRDLFATGGKQLTGKEESLASRFEIQPGDNASQIRTKGAGLTDYLESDFAAQIAGMEAVNPERAAQLREKAAQTISGVRSYFLNASQKRAQAAQEPKGRAVGDVAGSAKHLKIAPGIVDVIKDPSQIVKKEYSPSRDKTRITLKNGKSVVVSGDQR